MEKDYFEMISKMENEFKLIVVHFTRLNPMQICACAWIYRLRKKIVNSGLGRTRPLGRWATGPLDHWAAGPLGRWAIDRGSALSKAQRSVVAAVVCMYIFSHNKSHPVVVIDAFTRGLKKR